jgi:hypothetical protein
MSLLTIVQQALGELGLGSPASVVGNADPNIARALALTNRAGLVLRDIPYSPSYWQALRGQFLFNLLGIGPFNGTFTAGSKTITNVAFTGTGTGLAGVQVGWQVSSQYALNDTMVTATNPCLGTVTMSQASTLSTGSAVDSALAFGQEAYPLPTDINYFVPGTGWDRNFRWQLLGPINAEEWQVIKSGISPVGPRLRYRLMGNQIYMNPAPYVPTGQSSPISDLIVMEYAKINWVTPQGGSAPTQTSFQLDTDTCTVFAFAQANAEDLLTLSLKWRTLKAIGNAYAEEFDEYEKALQQASGRQTMARALPLNARAGQLRLINSQQVPDTGFGA